MHTASPLLQCVYKRLQGFSLLLSLDYFGRFTDMVALFELPVQKVDFFFFLEGYGK